MKFEPISDVDAIAYFFIAGGAYIIFDGVVKLKRPNETIIPAVDFGFKYRYQSHPAAVSQVIGGFALVIYVTKEILLS